MSNIEIIFVSMVSLAPIISVLVAIIVTRRNKDKNIKKEAHELGQMESDLVYIK